MVRNIVFQRLMSAIFGCPFVGFRHTSAAGPMRTKTRLDTAKSLGTNSHIGRLVFHVFAHKSKVVTTSVLVTTSKAPVPSSVALVPSSFLFLLVTSKGPVPSQKVHYDSHASLQHPGAYFETPAGPPRLSTRTQLLWRSCSSARLQHPATMDGTS